METTTKADLYDNQNSTPWMGTSADPNEIALGRVICEQGTPNLERIQFRLHAGRSTAPGRIVGVRHQRPTGEDILTLARVVSIKEFNPHEDALGSTVADVIPYETRYAPEGRSTVIYRSAIADLLEEILLDEAGGAAKIVQPETLPLSGNDIVEAAPEMIAAAVGFAQDPAQGYVMGAVHGSPNTPAILNRSVVQTHVFLAGSIGRGKSYARGVLAEELADHGVPQINIDPMGEMVKATEELGGKNVKPGVGFKLPLSALTADDVLDAIPGVNKSTNIATLIAYAHNSLLNSERVQNGGYFGVRELVERIDQVAPDLNMQAAGTLRPAKERASALARIDFIGEPFDWETELKPGSIINIDCRLRPVPELKLIAASVARDIQRLAVARKIPFVVLSMDEAHLIAPNDDKSVTTQVMREIARIGRHYQIGLIMTTQSPADMDRSVLKRLLTRLIFAIEPDQLESLRGVFADAPEEMIRQLPKLPIGACVATGVSETVKHAVIVDIRKRTTTAGGTTPDIFADLAKRGWQERKRRNPAANGANGAANE